VIILVRGRDGNDTKSLMGIFEGVEGMHAFAAVPEDDQQVALLVARSVENGSILQDLSLDLSVSVLIVADNPAEAVEAVLSGAGDAVLCTAGRDELRLRAELLLKPSCGKACTSTVFSRILRTELGRSGREGYELSLVSANVGTSSNPWSLSEDLSSSIRSTDTPGITTDGRVVVLLPCTPPEKASVVVKRLRTVLLAQGLGCSFRLAGGHIGHMTPAEALKLLAEAPELP
jgi:hypothetical protein